MNKGLLVVIISAIVVGSGALTYVTYGSGRLVVDITDPPQGWGPATSVYIHYSQVKLHRANAENESGWVTVVDSEGWVDLKETLNASKTLGIAELQAGTYNLVRFEILEAKVTVDGMNYTTPVESGKLNIAIVQGGVTIQAGQTTTLTIDITPKVVGSKAGGFKLVPAAKALPS